MNVALSEGVITGLKEIQDRELDILDNLLDIEGFVLDCDLTPDSERTLSVARQVRLLRMYLKPLFHKETIQTKTK